MVRLHVPLERRPAQCDRALRRGEQGGGRTRPSPDDAHDADRPRRAEQLLMVNADDFEIFMEAVPGFRSMLSVDAQAFEVMNQDAGAEEELVASGIDGGAEHRCRTVQREGTSVAQSGGQVGHLNKGPSDQHLQD